MRNKVTENNSILNVERFDPDINDGLSEIQVNQRIDEKLTNRVPKKYSKSYFSIIKDNLFTFFNLLGVIVCIALILIQASMSRFFFVVIYTANILIGIIQEIRAKRCIDRLSLMSSKTISVLRSGNLVDILSQDLVLDDIYFLSPGDQVPTDSIIVDGNIEVNESLLTGEQIAVKKGVNDSLYSGSFIISGKCKLKADKIGSENYVEKLSAKAKKYKKPHSKLMNSLQIIIKVIGAIIFPIAFSFILKSWLFYDVSTFEIIDRACTVVIGMIPSGMFLLTSLALAVGVIKLSQHNTLVQDLYSLEMLARVDTICFDKTGTITDGRMSVEQVIPLSDDDVNVVMSSMLNYMTTNNQTETALRDYFGSIKANVKSVLQFNSSRKFCAVTFDNDLTYSFGAPEFILSDVEYKKISTKIDTFASLGQRVILLAKSRRQIIDDNPPNDFSPVALIVLCDNIREEAIKTIAWFKENDVTVKVISGDNPITVSTVSIKAGIDNADKYISLEGKSDQEIMELANEYTVFGRVTPEQKAVLVSALKTAGHVTAMTGDGVNDLLALKEADCAISIGSGSQAAKNISHLVLLDNDFNSMPKVVREGRRVINNIQGSASLYLMKTLFTMFFAILTLCLPSVPTYPFKLSQMILMEMVIIALPSFVISLQPNDSRVESDFIPYVISKTLPSAILMVISVLIVEIFKAILGTTTVITNDVYSTMNVMVLNFAGLISVYHVCKPFNKLRSILFASTTIILTSVSVFALIFGFKMFDLVKMVPLLPEMWHHLLIVVLIIFMDMPLSILLKKAFQNVKTIQFKKHVNK